MLSGSALAGTLSVLAVTCALLQYAAYSAGGAVELWDEEGPGDGSYHPGQWLAAQREGRQEPGHLSASSSDDDHPRLFSRGNTGVAEQQGDYVSDNSIGVEVANMKAHQQSLVSQADPARMQSLLLGESWLRPINPYLPPRDLYLFWGLSSATGTLASGFSGGRGRASSGERIRQVLKLGDFTGNGYVDDATGHGKFLRSWEGPQFEGLAVRCCTTLLVPPMERHLPISSDEDPFARKMRSFVANGNMLIMTGGDYSSLVFINRYFHFDLRKTVYDGGPFEKLPDESLPPNAKDAFADTPETLPQDGLSVTTITKESLPPGTQLLYATPVSSPVFQITYCETVVPDDQCRVLKPAGHSCARDVLPQDCDALKKQGSECSCGTILYLGNDYVEHHSHTIGSSVWDEVLRAAVAVDKIGTRGLGEFTVYT